MKLRTIYVKSSYLPSLTGAFMILVFSGWLASCNNTSIPETEIVDLSEQIDEKAGVIIKEFVNKAIADSGKINDSLSLFSPLITQQVYDKRTYTTIWSEKDSLFPAADSMLLYINNARENGLYPENYHASLLNSIISHFKLDTSGTGPRKDAALWARADVLLTDAFAKMLVDIKLGRLPDDSISIDKDSSFSTDLVVDQLDFLLRGKSMRNIIAQFEPKLAGYQELKTGIRKFLEHASFGKSLTQIPFPVKDSDDFRAKVFSRMKEELLVPDTLSFDNSTKQLTEIVKEYQRQNGLTDDGKIGAQTAKRMNTSDDDRFLQLAITMDRYKQLPDQMPDKYVWVNIPAYKLQLFEDNTVKFDSKVVVGKPLTRTPVLTSAISQMITYPQWTIPTSIIVKEVLPGLKKDPGYLARKGYSLIKSDGEEVDPYTVDWSKYSKGIPYKVVQGSGDANALGVMKFNFNNKYSVYLHDTNQRYYFSKAERALSHGCVRVQAWRQMTDYILRNDSMQAIQNNNRNFLRTDSVNTWLVNKEKHTIAVKNRIPLFIRYFTCATENDSLVFYDDIYNENDQLRKYYSASK